MEQILIEALTETPSLVVVIVLVVTFLRHIKGIVAEFSETIKTIQVECRESEEKMTEAFNQNTTMLGRIEKQLDGIDAA